MRGTIRFGGFPWSNFSKLAAAAILLTAAIPARSVAQQAGQSTFRSAVDASKALVAAARDNDVPTLLKILGPGAKNIVSSGDEAEDAENRANFVRRYDQMHRLVKEPDGTTTLYVGAENWPMPIPLVERGSAWHFDTAAGEKEILYRRVGRNEMSTIRVCEQLVAAQKEYYAAHADEYAQEIVSENGKQNGLYWKTANGSPESPIGPLVAGAAPGYTEENETPYLGYYYHILAGQGASAKGGAKNYIVDGKMTGGFAFVAYPAEYRSSGVMTFIVDQDGVLYQKDLGRNTSALAKAMKEYDPGAGWQKVQNEQEETALQQSK